MTAPFTFAHELKRLYLLIGISTLLRIFWASVTPFGNDEVYYFLYALYPDWSYFDHPPIVGLLVRLTTLNLWLDSEVFVRLGGILVAALNTYLLYDLTRRIASHTAAYTVAVLYNACLYTSLIAGVFILPDSPQVLFWVLGIRQLVYLAHLPKETQLGKEIVWFGLWVALAVLCKYHGAFLGIGLATYMVLFRRAWLASPYLYAAAGIALLGTLPILYWNAQHDFVSFGFHTERIDARGTTFQPKYFFTELAGQILYQNPVVYFLIVVTLIARIKQGGWQAYEKALLSTALPLWLVFTSFALFRKTLPHWTGPAFLPLLVLTGIALAQQPLPRLRKKLVAALALPVLGLPLAYLLLFYAPVQLGNAQDPDRLGKPDEALDLLGWPETLRYFKEVREDDLQSRQMLPSDPMLSYRWFPAANIEYYVCRPLGMKMLAYGELERIHLYHWLNKARGELRVGESAYFIDLSNHHQKPEELFSGLFERIEDAGTFPIYRGTRHVKNIRIYRLKNRLSEH